MQAGDDHYRATYLLNSLGLTGEEDPVRLSGGEARRAALARVLAPEPDIILLDEPTNHLDLPAIEWLENELASIRSALVIISHDRRFLADLTRSTVWIDRGVTRRLDQGFAGFEEWRDQVLEEEETARHKLDRQIVREEHWLTYGVTARRKRNVRRLEGLFNLRQERRELKRWRRRGEDQRRRGRCVGQDGDRCRGHLEKFRRPRRSSATSRPASSAATGWASSAPMAPARPR